MQIDRPLRVVTPTLDGDVLAVVARADAEFTPPQVQALVGEYSVEGVRKAMRRLGDQGILLRRRAGNALLYQLNREHLAAPAVIALACQKDALVARLRDALRAWPVQARYAALFGSAASGRMTPDSDIDLFVVRPDGADDDLWSAQIADLERAATAWTGNDTRVLEYDHADLAGGLASGEGLLLDIERHGVRLAGPGRYFIDARL